MTDHTIKPRTTGQRFIWFMSAMLVTAMLLSSVGGESHDPEQCPVKVEEGECNE